jgi:hypothetical protein
MIGVSRRFSKWCRRAADELPGGKLRGGSVRQLACCGAAFLLLTVSGGLLAQTGQTFTARLSWVPISGAERDDVGGRGSVRATLSGSTLSVAGEFEGLPAPAAAARLHQGIAMGARGPAIAELNVTHAADGTISGEVRLDDEHLDALGAGKLYVQVHGERGVAPDNSILWGWLLP